MVGKRIIAAPERQNAGIWPYESDTQHYETFIIGYTEGGTIMAHSCNPETLSNFFGKNPTEPHYLTPVCFRPDVLQKYYDEPDKYSVEDGYLRRAGLWGVQIDNNAEDFVMVFLGDLGRDLPERERAHWRSYNIPLPDVPISKTAYQRSFLGQFAEPTRIDIIFRGKYLRFRRAWKEVMGWDLFRDPNPGDEHVLSRTIVPLTDSMPAFEEQLLNLTKVLVDFLNDKDLKTHISSPTQGMKSIAKLDAWLTQEGYPNCSTDVALLRILQDLRSKGAAHGKGSDWHQVLQAAFPGRTRPEIVREILQQAVIMLDGLMTYFLTTPDGPEAQR